MIVPFFIDRHSHQIVTAAVSPKKDRIACLWSDGRLRIATPNWVHEEEGTENTDAHLVFSLDGSYLVTSGGWIFQLGSEGVISRQHYAVWGRIPLFTYSDSARRRNGPPDGVLIGPTRFDLSGFRENHRVPYQRRAVMGTYSEENLPILLTEDGEVFVWEPIDDMLLPLGRGINSTGAAQLTFNESSHYCALATSEGLHVSGRPYGILQSLVSLEQLGLSSPIEFLFFSGWHTLTCLVREENRHVVYTILINTLDAPAAHPEQALRRCCLEQRVLSLTPTGNGSFDALGLRAGQLVVTHLRF